MISGYIFSRPHWNNQKPSNGFHDCIKGKSAFFQCKKKLNKITELGQGGGIHFSDKRDFGNFSLLTRNFNI